MSGPGVIASSSETPAKASRVSPLATPAELGAHAVEEYPLGHAVGEVAGVRGIDREHHDGNVALGGCDDGEPDRRSFRVGAYQVGREDLAEPVLVADMRTLHPA